MPPPGGQPASPRPPAQGRQAGGRLAPVEAASRAIAAAGSGAVVLAIEAALGKPVC